MSLMDSIKKDVGNKFMGCNYIDMLIGKMEKCSCNGSGDCNCIPVSKDTVTATGAIEPEAVPVIPSVPISVVNYKFNEDNLLAEVKEYINSSYFGHYAKGANKVQTSELIASDPLRGLHFSIGNVIKYTDRLGHKDGYNRKDILKSVHYALIALDCLDKLKESEDEVK